MPENGLNKNLKIGELPKLEIVSVDRLTFHEDPDQARLVRLVERLGNETILKNPPIVARIDDNHKLVILDGANRATALMKLGFRHIIVQVVDFDDDLLDLQCWHHAIEKLDRSFFLIKLSKIDGIKVVEREPFETDGDYRQLLGGEEKDYLCRIIFRDNSVVAVKGSEDILTQMRQLKEVTSVYITTPFMDRVSYIDMDNLKLHYPDFQSLVTFRQLSKDDVLKVINSGLKIPAGVTRVFLPKRALGLNVQLELLKADLTLEEKNSWLESTILSKVRDKSIRFYREPTFRFDE